MMIFKNNECKLENELHNLGEKIEKKLSNTEIFYDFFQKLYKN